MFNFRISRMACFQQVANQILTASSRHLISSGFSSMRLCTNKPVFTTTHLLLAAPRKFNRFICPEIWFRMLAHCPHMILSSAHFWISIWSQSIHAIFQDFTDYTNLEECVSFLCDYISKNGPFDGFLGFSQVPPFPILHGTYSAINSKTILSQVVTDN